MNTDPDDLQFLFQTNLYAPFALTKAFLPSITKAKGNIINIGIAGLNAPRASKTQASYDAIKMALLSLTKSLALDLATTGVRVNMVSPGYLTNSVVLPSDPLSLPMHRTGALDEVARAITFLIDPASSYITGQNIEVSGGVAL
jgi:NAD(P)-dependent dehydrogenase (short-subunit alcohol dehydrogenase family)